MECACEIVTLAACQMSAKVTVPPLHSWTGQRKYNKGFVSQKKGREESLTRDHHRQNRLEMGKSVQFITNQIRVGLEIKSNL